MTMVRGAFSNLLAPGFRKIFFETYKQRALEGTRLVNMNTSKRAFEEDFPIAGFTTLVNKPEGAGFMYQDAVQGSIKRYTWTTYALGFRITEEMMEDDLYGVMGNKMSKALGRSSRNNQEIVMHAPYNFAFNAGVNGFVAGEALCGDHTSIKGVVQRNRPTVDADIGLLAFQAAVEHFDNLVDEAGLPMLLVPKLLAHGPSDQWIVDQILKTPNLPGGNQNDINRASRLGVTGHMSHYFTDSDQWFLLADEHDVNYFDRRALKFANSDDFETGDAKYKVTRRNGSGFGDWRGVYGSSGL